MTRVRSRQYYRPVLLILAVLLGGMVAGADLAHVSGAEGEPAAVVKRYRYSFNEPVMTVVGAPAVHALDSGETLLDVARNYGLGYNEIALFYPKLDPWIPPASRTLLIPSQWVLPPSRHEELLINLAELRLYFFDKPSGTVQTYPIGIGDEGWETPLGTFSIVEKRPNPAWYVPASLQEKYGMAVMPPGPENPLGEYMMKFSAGAYGIHGTALPWGVGRLVSHGCIRMYPEHVRLLYPQVRMGARLEIIYEPMKLGRQGDQIFVEVHPDVYQKIPDFSRYAHEKLQATGWADQVDKTRFLMAVRLQNGAPINITKSSRPAGITSAAKGL